MDTITSGTPTPEPTTSPVDNANANGSTNVTANGSASVSENGDPVGGRTNTALAEGSADTQPLEQFAPGGPHAATPAVTVNGLAVVVLARHGDAVEVFHDDRTLTLAGDVAATPVTDPHRRSDLLRAALAHSSERRAATQAQLDRAVCEHQGVLAEIRDYAIERHRAGDICRNGLDEFLTTFDMAPYRPQVRVPYTITGSYTVEDSDPDTAASDARGYLRPDLDELDGVVEDSDTYSVYVDDVTDVEG